MKTNAGQLCQWLLTKPSGNLRGSVSSSPDQVLLFARGLGVVTPCMCVCGDLAGLPWWGEGYWTEMENSRSASDSLSALPHRLDSSIFLSQKQKPCFFLPFLSPCLPLAETAGLVQSVFVCVSSVCVQNPDELPGDGGNSSEPTELYPGHMQ